MKILLKNGKMVLVPNAKQMIYKMKDQEMEVKTGRGRLLVTFRVSEIVAYWYDNEIVEVVDSPEEVVIP